MAGKLTENLGVRFTPLEMREVKRAAKLLDKLPTQFIRERAVADARIVLDGERKRQAASLGGIR